MHGPVVAERPQPQSFQGASVSEPGVFTSVFLVLPTVREASVLHFTFY